MKKAVIVGFGGMGGWHSRKIRENNVVELKGIFDISERANQRAKDAGIYTYDSFESVLNDPDIDLVTVATPNDVHKEIVIALLNAGKNVICEKPVTMTEKDFGEMSDAATKNGVVFTVHQNRRWDSDFLLAKQLYENGEMGDVFCIESRVHGSRGIPGDWRGKKEYGGGMMLDWGVHLIDQALMMIPEKIKKLYCKFDHVTNYEVDDGFKLDLYFESGLVYRIEVSTSNFISLPRWYILADDGTAVFESFSSGANITKCKEKNEANVIPVVTAAGLTKTMAPRSNDNLITYDLPLGKSDVHDFYRNVVDTIDGKSELIVKHDQIARVLRVMEAAAVSDATCQVIDFE